MQVIVGSMKVVRINQCHVPSTFGGSWYQVVVILCFRFVLHDQVDQVVVMLCFRPIRLTKWF